MKKTFFCLIFLICISFSTQSFAVVDKELFTIAEWNLPTAMSDVSKSYDIKVFQDGIYALDYSEANTTLTISTENYNISSLFNSTSSLTQISIQPNVVVQTGNGDTVISTVISRESIADGFKFKVKLSDFSGEADFKDIKIRLFWSQENEFELVLKEKPPTFPRKDMLIGMDKQIGNVMFEIYHKIRDQNFEYEDLMQIGHRGFDTGLVSSTAIHHDTDYLVKEATFLFKNNFVVKEFLFTPTFTLKEKGIKVDDSVVYKRSTLEIPAVVDTATPEQYSWSEDSNKITSSDENTSTVKVSGQSVGNARLELTANDDANILSDYAMVSVFDVETLAPQYLSLPLTSIPIEPEHNTPFREYPNLVSVDLDIDLPSDSFANLWDFKINVYSSAPSGIYTLAIIPVKYDWERDKWVMLIVANARSAAHEILNVDISYTNLSGQVSLVTLPLEIYVGYTFSDNEEFIAFQGDTVTVDEKFINLDPVVNERSDDNTLENVEFTYSDEVNEENQIHFNRYGTGEIETLTKPTKAPYSRLYYVHKVPVHMIDVTPPTTNGNILERGDGRIFEFDLYGETGIIDIAKLDMSLKSEGAIVNSTNFNYNIEYSVSDKKIYLHIYVKDEFLTLTEYIKSNLVITYHNLNGVDSTKTIPFNFIILDSTNID